MGEARIIGSPPKRATPPIPARNWVPPEVLAPNAKADSYVLKSDVFGLGLVLSEVYMRIYMYIYVYVSHHYCINICRLYY